MKEAPSLSVLVSTRNRPDQILECVQSVLTNDDASFELIVVDQSDGDDSRAALGALIDAGQVRYFSTPTRGLSRSRNVGLSHARGELLVFTDDDCRVPRDWVSGMRALFEADPALGMAFGAVGLRPEDRAIGYAAEFAPEAVHVLQHSLPDMRRPLGVGANMAMRRSLIDRVGDFDPLLGAGAPLVAAEEIDLTFRALAAGLKVMHTPQVEVIHLGIRRGAELQRLIRGYGFGLGAMFAKHVRLGTPGATAALADWLMLHGRRSLNNALKGDRRPGFGLVASVLAGVAASARYGLERDSGHYVARSLG